MVESLSRHLSHLFFTALYFISNFLSSFFLFFFYSFFYLEATFINQPEFQLKPKTVGDKLILLGCNIQNEHLFTEDDFYFLKDGSHRINTNCNPKYGNATMAGLLLNVTSYRDQGYDQCAVFNKMFMGNEVKSGNVTVQLEGRFPYFCLSYIL